MYSMLKANVSSEDRGLIAKFIFSDSGHMTRETSDQSDKETTEAEGELPEFFCGFLNFFPIEDIIYYLIVSPVKLN